VEYPKMPIIENGRQLCRQIIGETQKLWVGKVSDLTVSDCYHVGSVVGRWSCPGCMMNLMNVLFANPFLMIPVGDI